MKVSYLMVYVYLFVFMSVCSAQEHQYNYTLFINSALPGDYACSDASNTNKSTIKNNNGKLPTSDKVFHTPGNALVLQYKNAAGGKWQAAVFAPHTVAKDNFTEATFLSFWIYKTTPTKSNTFPLIQLVLADSSLTSSFPITAETNSWQRIMVPIEIFGKLATAKPIEIAGIMFSQQGNNNGDEQTIYVDDIEFLSTDRTALINQMPTITSIKEESKTVQIVWDTVKDSNIHLVKIYRSVNGTDYKPLAVQQPGNNSYEDSTGEKGKRYFYKISFLNSAYRETAPSLSVTINVKKTYDENTLTMSE